MTNLYTSLDHFKSRANLNITGSTDDVRLERLIEAVSREIDDHLAGRHFYSLTATRYFDGNGKTRIRLPWDVIAITTLKEDDVHDGTYNVTWSTTDYELTPYDANPTGETDRSRPYEAIEVNLRSNGSQDVFLKGQKRYEIVGRFGYWERLDDLGVDVSSSGAFESSATTFLVGALGVGSTKLEVGMTIKIDNEQMYVEGRTTGSSAMATIKRAINGTVASSHADSADIQVYRYPRAITEAVIQQASRIWSRRTQGYANQLTIVESGNLGPMVSGMDNDVKDLIKPYRPMVA